MVESAFMGSSFTFFRCAIIDLSKKYGQINEMGNGIADDSVSCAYI